MPVNPSLVVGHWNSNAVVSPATGLQVSTVALTDATGDLANINSTGQLNVSNGLATAGLTLNAVTAGTIGTTVDATVAQSNWSAVAVATGSPTSGVIVLELSLDNVNWVSSGSTNSITAAGSYPVFSTGRVARYGRVSLYNPTGTISLTVLMMAAG